MNHQEIEFDQLLEEVKQGYQLGMSADEKLSRLAQLSGIRGTERLIRELDRLDDADLVDDSGDMADAYWRLRGAITRTLAKIGGKALPSLIKALSSQNPQTRAHSARAIGEMKAVSAADGLMQHLAIEDNQVALRGIIWALGEIKDPRGVSVLCALLPQHGVAADKWLVRTVANALGAIGTDDAIQMLRLLYENNSDWFKRLGAVEGLSVISSLSAQDVLSNASGDADSRVRRVAEEALLKHRTGCR
jgi:HEAT repeat protein